MKTDSVTHQSAVCSRLITALFCGVSLALSGCAQIEEKEPEYNVVMEHQLHAGMSTMAEHLNKIARLAFVDSLSEEEKTPTVLYELEQIKGFASDIAGPGQVTNYSVLNRYMDAFLYDVNVAEQFSRRMPPNHHPAYTLVKSCMACHESR